MYDSKSRFSAISLATIMLSGCLDLDISKEQISVAAQNAAETAAAKARNAFPEDFVLASPVESVSADGMLRNAGAGQRDLVWMQRQLKDIRNGRQVLANVFTVDSLRNSNSHSNASCYGPALMYRNHPGLVGSEMQVDESILPSGDLGIWSATDDQTDEACAAAQMNAKLYSVRSQTFAAMSIFSSMLVETGKAERPIDNITSQSVDVLDEMNSVAPVGVSFSMASVAFDAIVGVWRYKANMDLRGGSFDKAHNVRFAMHFYPGETEQTYSGRINLIRDGETDVASCASTETSLLTSIVFERSLSGEIKTEARTATFCGDGHSLDSDEVVDTDQSLSFADDNWISNLSIFTANYTVETYAGYYGLSWQAGPNDTHSRVLNLSLSAVSPQGGEAWFGFGDSLNSDDAEPGIVKGFICNWAGPGNSHMLIPRAQRQLISLNEETSLFEVTSAGSDITYAPVNGCTYDSDNGGAFLYDRNLNSDLSDETAASVDVGIGEVLELDLFPTTGSSYESMSIQEAIAARGYQVPTAPVIE